MPRKAKAVYTVVVKFQDENMPKMRYVEKTQELAGASMAHAVATFASIKHVDIFTPTGDNHVFNGRGDYMFTIPAGLLA